MSFPEGFLWGSATSSHQVEGGNRNNDWWAWEQQPGHIHDGTTSGDAVGWWEGRAEEDLRRARELGQNAHRLSLEWSRIEPAPGKFDHRALDRYRAILGAARELGLTPLVTLNHFTLPRWVAQAGAWTSGETIVEAFVRYALEAVNALGDLVPRFATLNEPSVLGYLGYAGHQWPPGRQRPLDAFRAIGHMLRAHDRCYRALKRLRPEVEVGLVLNAPLFEPAHPSRAWDRAIARAQDWAITGAILHALRKGRGWPPLPPLRLTPGAFDFLGLNYYGRYAVSFDPTAGSEFFGRHVQSPTVRTEHNDWGQVCPRGLTEQLLRFHALGKPLYVTENGIYDNDDSQRAAFIVRHVEAVGEAISRGAEVRGYFHWSLVDNFEWAEGWRTHFGLMAVDRATGARTIRASAQVYAALCRTNGASIAPARPPPSPPRPSPA